MDYISTRGEAPVLPFADAMLTGLASDGGLYVPQTIPTLTQKMMENYAGLSFAETAHATLSPYLEGWPGLADLPQMLARAYGGFRHPSVTPLVQLDDNLFVLELYHGPTLAFKDVAMQLLGQMMDYELKRRNRRATIVGATSGDTGAAAIAAFAGLSQVDVFILYPYGRVSPVQQRQMTTIDAPNVHTLALDGTFDDCQALLKGLFGHHRLAAELSLSSVNSINWARVMAQMSYYFTAAASLGAPERKISFTVPSGNFGDVLAGFYAKRMGLPIDRLVVASNSNNILTRAIQNGDYHQHQVQATSSPSMDIQISSNFERLLFEAHNRDAQAVRVMMQKLAQTRGFDIPQPILARIQADFSAGSVDEIGVQQEITRSYKQSGFNLDPHSAVGVATARSALARAPQVPMVVLATAHPAKFPEAVEAAIGVRPLLPDFMRGLMDKKERIERIENTPQALERFIRAHACILRD